MPCYVEVDQKLLKNIVNDFTDDMDPSHQYLLLLTG